MTCSPAIALGFFLGRMTMDRTAKILLAVIAAGLWANAVAPMITPQAQAQSRELAALNAMERSLHNISELTEAIAWGRCRNSKLC